LFFWDPATAGALRGRSSVALPFSCMLSVCMLCMSWMDSVAFSWTKVGGNDSAHEGCCLFLSRSIC
jgi:endonuclease V-like protein UPF0215 family